MIRTPDSSYFSAAVGQVGEASENFLTLSGLPRPKSKRGSVADWGNTVAKDPDFRGCHQEMQHWLSTQRSVHFDDPESFSHYNPDRSACHDKLSAALVASSIECCDPRQVFESDPHGKISAATINRCRQSKVSTISEVACPTFATTIGR